MGSFSGSARILAGVTALVAWAGLVIQFEASMQTTGTALGALVSMLRYFTVLANLTLAIVLTGVALGRRSYGAPSLLGGAALSMLLVGIIYSLLLRDLVQLSGGAELANVLLHYTTPILAPLFWLAYAPKGALRARDPLVWMIFPLVYLLYALARGHMDGVYAYPFMDVAKIGWARTGLNAVAIAIGFVLSGYVLVWLDGRLARRT
jgi:hypothetical protein